MNAKEKNQLELSRRQFLKSSILVGAAAGIGFPTIVPSSVLGKDAPSNKIIIGQIGCGRIGTTSEIPGVLRNSNLARYVAACDVDSKRLAQAKQLIEKAYAKKNIKSTIKTYGAYRELLADKSIDAVCVSVPDFWHAQIAIEAAQAGKHIYLQKPASITIMEGREMADAVKHAGVIFQQGSQQRSDKNFRKGCELVRNGRIGKLKEIHIGLPTDPALKVATPEMPVPSNLNYDMWLGSTPMVPYTEKRVHPQNSVQDRPGWMCIEAYCAGMITNWGAHHVDIAHWGMDTEHTGPIEASGTATYHPNNGIWTVPATFKVELKYANGVTMFIDCGGKTPNGVKFVGEKGWIFVSRGAQKATASDPTANMPVLQALDASDRKLLEDKKPLKTKLHASPKNDHHLDWLTAIKSKGETVAPAEVGHRSCSACLVGQIAMKRDGKKLTWDPKAERFTNDEQANAMLERPQRAPYGTKTVLKSA